MQCKEQSPKPERLLSLDAYRGFIMLGLVSGYFGLHLLARIPWRFAPFFDYQTNHVAWTGCSAWDLIQPSFMFIMGVAMPYSYAARKARGDSRAGQTGHAVYRALVLIFLGVFLRSIGREQTNFTFEDVISQIGLAYILLFLLLDRGIKAQAMAAGVILVGYWLLFALWPLPGPGFDSRAAGLPDEWQFFTGFAAHWNKGLNPLGWFDQWFLNLFPRKTPYTFHGGGYGTLSFIPSMGTMLFGIMTGELLRSERPLTTKFRTLVIAGLSCLAFGLAVDGHIWPFVDWHWSVAPIVKRIWTPSWAVFSTGWTLLILSMFVWVVDIKGYKRWTFPLIVVGMNSLAMYVMDHTIRSWIGAAWDTNLGYAFTGATWWEGVREILTVVTLWLICFWMYRKKLFIRI